MEKILKHLQELRGEAEALVKSGACDVSDEQPSYRFIAGQGSCSDCAGVNWLENARKKSGQWRGRPLVVLSLFDGIGGAWAALCKLGIPFIGYSCEVFPEAIEVTKRNYPSVRHLGDIKKLEREDIMENVDLVIGGFPCQDLSCLGMKMGLHGTRSRLFFEMLRVLKIFTPTWFLAENVASMSWIDREEISRHLSITPVEIDSATLTPCRRRRIYWSNIPYPKLCPSIKEREETSIQSVVEQGAALATKNTCVLTGNITEIGRGSMEQVYDFRKKKIRYISAMEVELMMGYPPNYTNIQFEGYAAKSEGARLKTRCRLLGNTFSVPVICYLLSPLLEWDVRERTRNYYLPMSVREKDCSAMAPGEVWAMYNSHQRPNWYAKIISRYGERFEESGYKPGTKPRVRQPLHVEVIFLELTKPYETGETDLWSTIRGSGLYVLTKMIDVQETWISFSHRVTSMLKLDNDQYFIYPGKGEVWSIYDRGTEGHYLVYVLESTINKQNAKNGIPRKEGFSARCRLLQKKNELDLYAIIDVEVVYDDLGIFSFRAPYHFHNDRDTLKIELSIKDRERRAQSDRFSRKRRRGSSESDYDDFFDMDTEEDIAGDSDFCY